MEKKRKEKGNEVCSPGFQFGVGLDDEGAEGKALPLARSFFCYQQGVD